jgi:hypothetical protein
MELLIFFVLGWLVGSLLAVRSVLKAVLRDRINELSEQDDMSESANSSRVKIPIMSTSLYNNEILLYNNENTFMCQGSSLEELASNLVEHQHIKIAYVVHEHRHLWFIDGKIKANVK